MGDLKRFLAIAMCAGSLMAQSNGDYQTVKSGNWNDVSVWQVFTGAWTAATTSPDSTSKMISILPGDTVTVTADVGVDSVFVQSGGSVIVKAGVTLTVAYNNDRQNGLALLGPEAMQVYGKLKNTGRITGSRLPRTVDFDPAVDTLVVKYGGVIEHARNGGDVPIAKWEEGSTFLVTGLTANYFGSQPQNYYNVVWNCPKQTRGDGRLNMYRNRVRGDFIVESNGTQVGGDRDIRLCDSFPTRATVYEDTVWFDGNIILKTAPAGQWSRLAISGGGNTKAVYVLIVKGNIIIGDSCVFGRTNSQAQNRLYLQGDLTVAPGGTIRTGQNNPYQQKIFIFNKKGTQKLTIGDGTGHSSYKYTVGGPLSFQVASGTTLDIGTSKIPKTTTGFFVIDNGGAVKITYGANSGSILSTGESCVVDANHDTLGGAATANGNSCVFARNVVGTGTITYAAAAPPVSDPAKAITRAWTITPSAGIKSGDLVVSYSPYDIPATAAESRFVTMKYAGAGTKWVNRGPVNAIIDEVFGTATYTHSDTMLNVKDLGGVWSVGDSSLTTKEVASTDSVCWRVLTQPEFGKVWNSQDFGNVIGDSLRFADITKLEGCPAPTIGGTYIARSGSWGIGISGDPDSSFNVARIDWRTGVTYPGQTAAGWPGLATDTLNNVWVQFKVSPKAGYKFNVNSVSFDVSGAGNTTMRAKAFISTDPTFATKTQIYASAANLGSYVFDYVLATQLNVAVENGKSFYLRIYPWQHDQTAAAASKRVMVKRVWIKGIATPSASVGQELAGTPNEFKLHNAYPNPFNPTTHIKFELPVASKDVTLRIYNLLGQEVATLFDGHKQAGSYEIAFDASNLGSGLYFCRLQAGNSVDVKRLMLLK